VTAARISADTNRAVLLLGAGEVVGLPTETVYGLAADGLNESAVRRVFAIKGRPPGHPVILHVGTSADLHRYAESVPEAAEKLVRAFWPGPLTLVLRRSAAVPDVVTGGRDTVGLRMPAHPLALDVLRRLGRPLAAPSANRFGKVSPTSAEHVLADLGDDVPFVLDGGRCEVGLESTIVDLSGAVPRLRRPGKITIEDMWRGAGVAVEGDDGVGPVVPGSLPTHYAPRAPVALVAGQDLWLRARQEALRLKLGVICQTEAPLDLPPGVFIERLGQTGADLARDLYAALRRLDDRGVDLVLSVLPEAVGVGIAAIDRLERAAAPRD
jgi:L-threonylcarbamoyladenylate synthase